MTPKRHWFVGLCHRLAYATSIASIIWVVGTSPFALPLGGLAFWVVRLFDLPIALAGLLLPCNDRGLDLWFPLPPGASSCPHNPGPEFVLNHMRIGVLVYMLLFYAPNIFRAFRRRWRRRPVPVPPTVALTILIFLAAPGFCEARGPSTAEERQEAVRLVRALEEDPVGKPARKARQWLVAWLAEIPDITVSMCPALLGETFESDQKYGAELGLQQSLSSAAFMIAHPERAHDQLAVSIAGVEGVLAAYEALLAKRPEAHFPSLDALLEARERGNFGELVALHMKSCT